MLISENDVNSSMKRIFAALLVLIFCAFAHAAGAERHHFSFRLCRGADEQHHAILGNRYGIVEQCHNLECGREPRDVRDDHIERPVRCAGKASRKPAGIVATSVATPITKATQFVYFLTVGRTITQVSPDPIPLGTTTVTITGAGFQKGAMIDYTTPGNGAIQASGVQNVELGLCELSITLLWPTGQIGPLPLAISESLPLSPPRNEPSVYEQQGGSEIKQVRCGPQSSLNPRSQLNHLSYCVRRNRD
jgi:hypothetical protein